MKVGILDTTLRDGEQTVGISFNMDEKLAIAHLLLQKMCVDRIEVASARVSKGEAEAYSSICSWASDNGLLDRVEALGFVDGGESVRWIADHGGRVINILAKGSLRHLENQLRKTPLQHLDDIEKVLQVARDYNIRANLYLEDWSNGMLHSEQYVYQMVDVLSKMPIERIMLPDTLGNLNPWNTYELCERMCKRYPDSKFDFHAHNDYGLAVANSLSAVRAGISGIHVTVNGLGERSGNTSLAPLLASLTDQVGAEVSTDESAILEVCHYVSSISGIRIPQNMPIVGENVFTQSSGIHADGDCKGNLYANQLLPQRFGRERAYALGKMSGKASIIKNLNKLGISLTPNQIALVTNRIVELGDKKEVIEAEDLPYIIADVLKTGTVDERVKIINYSLQLTKGMYPVAQVKFSIDGKEYLSSASGGGQYDAFMKAVWKIYDRLKKPHPELVDFQSQIPPGGNIDALVVVSIRWSFNGHVFKTRGIDSDQTEAAIKATLKMLNIIEDMYIQER